MKPQHLVDWGMSIVDYLEREGDEFIYQILLHCLQRWEEYKKGVCVAQEVRALDI